MTDKQEMQEIFSKKVRAGRRTYFFDVRSTKAGDYYMTITESVKDVTDEGVSSYRKHKIYLYKEDFSNFKEAFEQVSSYIIAEKGEAIISDKKFEKKEEKSSFDTKKESSTDFTEVNFEDLGKD
ncbi:MAG: DUF3276 family protein [Bacteroidetes bacterium]|nr:DUF3276 family protein [Bacteroidota bacterium]